MAYGQINADLITTSAAQSLGAGNATNFKNRIINGAMMIDQRNAGASITPTSNGTYGVDRFRLDFSQASKFSMQQNAGSVATPAGFNFYEGMTVVAAYSSGASDYFLFRQGIEGQNVADLGWGTANAKTVTLSFLVYSSITGTHSGSLCNSAQNRSYPFTFTVSSANTWTNVSVTIAGDTTGSWLTTNGTGVWVNWNLGCGSTYLGAAGAWGGAAYFGATGATSVVGTNGATFYITGVQLEVGSAASSFEVRDYGRELILCQRYYQAYGGGGSIDNGSQSNVNDTYRRHTQFFPVYMRTAPTCTGVWNAGASGVQSNWVGSAQVYYNAGNATSELSFNSFTASAEL